MPWWPLGRAIRHRVIVLSVCRKHFSTLAKNYAMRKVTHEDNNIIDLNNRILVLRLCLQVMTKFLLSPGRYD